MLEVKTTKAMGRGIFATEDIKANTKVHEAYFIKTKDEEVDKCPDLAKYVFNYSKKYSVLCLGLGSLFNHSNNPSVEAYFDKNDNGEIMEFWTVRDVKAGEQLFISYGGENYAFSHLLKKEKKNFDLQDFVYSFKSKFKEGLTSKEVTKLVESIKKKMPSFSMEKYNDAMLCHTCPVVKGETLMYRHDVLMAIRCGIDNRTLKVEEWD